MEQSTSTGAGLDLDLVMPFRSQSWSSSHLAHCMIEGQMTPPSSPSSLFGNNGRRLHLSKLLRKSRTRPIISKQIDGDSSFGEEHRKSNIARDGSPGMRPASTQMIPPFQLPLLLPDSPPFGEDWVEEEEGPPASSTGHPHSSLRRMSASYHDLRAIAQLQNRDVPSGPVTPLLPSPIPRGDDYLSQEAERVKHFLKIRSLIFAGKVDDISLPEEPKHISQDCHVGSPVRDRNSSSDDGSESIDSAQILAYYCNDPDNSNDTDQGAAGNKECLGNAEPVMTPYCSTHVEQNSFDSDDVAEYDYYSDPGQDQQDEDVTTIDDYGDDGNDGDAHSVDPSTASEPTMPVTPSDHALDHDLEHGSKMVETGSFSSSDESGWLANTTSHEERRRRFKARFYQVVQHPWPHTSICNSHGGEEGYDEARVMIATVLIGVGPGKPRLVQIRRPPSSISGQSAPISSVGSQSSLTAPVDDVDEEQQCRQNRPPTSPSTSNPSSPVQPFPQIQTQDRPRGVPAPSTPVRDLGQAQGHTSHEVSAFSPYDTPGPRGPDSHGIEGRPQSYHSLRAAVGTSSQFSNKSQTGYLDDNPHDVSSSSHSARPTSPPLKLVPPPLSGLSRIRSSGSDSRVFSSTDIDAMSTTSHQKQQLVGSGDWLSASCRRSKSYQDLCLRPFQTLHWAAIDEHANGPKVTSQPVIDIETESRLTRLRMTPVCNDGSRTIDKTKTDRGGMHTCANTEDTTDNKQPFREVCFIRKRNISPSSPTSRIAAWSRHRRLERILQAATQSINTFPNGILRLDSPGIIEMRRDSRSAYSSPRLDDHLYHANSLADQNRTYIDAFHKIFPNAPTLLISALAAWILLDLYFERLRIDLERRPGLIDAGPGHEDDGEDVDVLESVHIRSRPRGFHAKQYPGTIRSQLDGLGGIHGEEDLSASSSLYIPTEGEEEHLQDQQDGHDLTHYCPQHCLDNTPSPFETHLRYKIPDKARKTLGIDLDAELFHAPLCPSISTSTSPSMSMSMLPLFHDHGLRAINTASLPTPALTPSYSKSEHNSSLYTPYTATSSLDETHVVPPTGSPGMHNMRERIETVHAQIPVIARTLVEALRGSWDEDVWRSLRVLVQVIEAAGVA